MRVTGDPARPVTGMFRDLADIGLGQPVEHDGDERDGDTLLHRLADLQLLQREQELLAEAGRANKRSDDGHGEGLHDDLVEAKHQRFFGGRHLNLPEQLARRAARHATRLENILRHGAQTKDGATGHGRQGEAEGSQHGGHLAKSEQDDDGCEIGHVRRGLHHVENRVENFLRLGIARRPDAKPEAECGGERHGDQNDGERLHRIGPQAEDAEIEGSEAAEDGKAPSASPMTQNGRTADNRHPGQRRKVKRGEPPKQQALDEPERP